jgi:apolipoprotein N-acyltransferase
MASQGPTLEESFQPGPSPTAVQVSLPLADPAPVEVAAPGAVPALLLGLATSGLLYLCYFPVNWGWLAWACLVPFLALVRRPTRRPRRLYLCAYAAGLVFYVPVLAWMPAADDRMYATWAGLSVYCALYFPLALGLLRRLDRRTGLPLVVTLPVVWTFLELVRASFIGLFVSLLRGDHQHDWPGGFGWYMLGHSQHDALAVIQVADLAGVYAVTFLLCLANGLAFELLFTWPRFRALFVGSEVAQPCCACRPGLIAQGLAVLLTVGATVGYGAWRLGQGTGEPGPVVALLQGNVPQSIRNEASDPDAGADVRKVLVNHYAPLSHTGAWSGAELLVWPETSFSTHWEEEAPGRPTAGSAELAKVVARDYALGRSASLLGLQSYVVIDRKERGYNSAVLITRPPTVSAACWAVGNPGGTLGERCLAAWLAGHAAAGQYAGRYDKVHRVPFGEYVPLRHSMPFLSALAPYNYDYSVWPGEQFTRFELPGPKRSWKFGVVICYEDTVPEMALPYGGEGGVDFLLSISNDGWFDGTSEHEQHLALCRFRAVECRRTVARAVNMGISAVIDSNGRVLRPEARPGLKGGPPLWVVPDEGRVSLPAREWRQYKKTSGVLLARLPVDGRGSLYARWGNWLPWSCGGLLLAALVVPGLRRRLAPARCGPVS